MRGKIIRFKKTASYKKKKKIDLTPFMTPCESINLSFVSLAGARDTQYRGCFNVIRSAI